jgi:hypothetical protein
MIGSSNITRTVTEPTATWIAYPFWIVVLVMGPLPVWWIASKTPKPANAMEATARTNRAEVSQRKAVRTSSAVFHQIVIVPRGEATLTGHSYGNAAGVRRSFRYDIDQPRSSGYCPSRRSCWSP